MPTLKSVRLKTKELSRFHSVCYNMKISLVSNRNVASAVRDRFQLPKNLHLLQTVFKTKVSFKRIFRAIQAFFDQMKPVLGRKDFFIPTGFESKSQEIK